MSKMLGYKIAVAAAVQVSPNDLTVRLCCNVIACNIKVTLKERTLWIVMFCWGYIRLNTLLVYYY